MDLSWPPISQIHNRTQNFSDQDNGQRLHHAKIYTPESCVISSACSRFPVWTAEGRVSVLSPGRPHFRAGIVWRAPPKNNFYCDLIADYHERTFIVSSAAQTLHNYALNAHCKTRHTKRFFFHISTSTSFGCMLPVVGRPAFISWLVSKYLIAHNFLVVFLRHD